MRCFVALDLPAPVRNHLADVTATLRGDFDVRWVPADQLHVTLVFAGELPDERASGLATLCREVELPPLSLALTEFGWFPPRGAPRVLWAGVGGDVDALAALQRTLAEGAARLGVPREKRPFTPHVPLGRLEGPRGAHALVDRLRELSAALRTKPFAPTALVLYRSTLTPRGPRHDPLVHRAR